MPRISEFYGIAIYMYYRDHAPPHFHAIYGDDDATFLIPSGDLDDGTLPRRARRLVEDWALLHPDELSDNWDRALRGELHRWIDSMLLHICEAEPVGDFLLRLRFSDGAEKVVNASPLLCGPVFQPLRDPGFFRQVSIDPVAKTVVWPNGADLAPESLYQLEPVANAGRT